MQTNSPPPIHAHCSGESRSICGRRLSLSPHTAPLIRDRRTKAKYRVGCSYELYHSSHAPNHSLLVCMHIKVALNAIDA